MTLFYIILATTAETFVALTGVLFLFLGAKKLNKYLPYLVSLSVGAFLALIFFNMLPEAINRSSVEIALKYTLIGFLFFFLLSRFLYWYHDHKVDTEVLAGDSPADNTINKTKKIKPSGYLILYGEVVHNAVDGIVIALAFLTDVNFGIATTIAVLFHEFPHQAVDFFVLISAGFKKSKALFFNFIAASSTLWVSILTYFLAINVGVDKIIGPALGVAAGNFLYLAASDLIPDLHSQHKKGVAGTLGQFSFILVGVALMYLLKVFIPE